MSEGLRNFLFTSESVTEGHPDKIADQISDAVLDEVMRQDPMGRVACETLVTTGLAVVAGEITTSAHVDYDSLVRETIRGVGYDDATYGYDGCTCAVMCTVKRQSPDIAMGVDTGGAGDQGLMFGFACDETDELMPMPIQLAHHLTQRLAEVRKSKKVDFLRPDGKSQVTIEYRNGRPSRVDTVVISTQHDEKVSTKNLHEAVMEQVIRPIVPASMLDRNTKYHINPTGRFVIGGPMGDAGVTGPEVQLAYAIGVAEPVSVMVDAFGTECVSEERITSLVRENFALTPKGIIEALDLRRPIYKATAAYGHFGRSGPGFTWERTDRAAALRKAAGLSANSSAAVEVGARA